jgi:hypothetical protein
MDTERLLNRIRSAHGTGIYLPTGDITLLTKRIDHLEFLLGHFIKECVAGGSAGKLVVKDDPHHEAGNGDEREIFPVDWRLDDAF